MAYTKTEWKNREVEKPRTFSLTENPDGTITLTPAEGEIIEPGTPIVAVTMNNIEDGIEAAHNELAGKETPAGAQAKADAAASTGVAAAGAVQANLVSHLSEEATELVRGHMSSADKAKLNGIATGANNYVHPGSGTNPHGTTKSDVGLANVTNIVQAPLTLTLNPQTANYIFAIGDAGKLITMDSTSARTFTIPLNSSVQFPIGAQILLTRINTGAVTVVATGGVTLNSPDAMVALRVRHSVAGLIKTATDTWSLFGDLG